MTMAPGIEAAASPHGRAAAAAAAAAAAYYPSAYSDVPNAAPGPQYSPTMHGGQADHAASAAAAAAAAVGGHPGPGAHAAHDASSFFASSDAASRYYQMQYESAQGKLL